MTDTDLAIIPVQLPEAPNFTPKAFKAREDLLVEASLIPNVISSPEGNVEAAAVVLRMTQLRLSAAKAAEAARRPAIYYQDAVITNQYAFTDELAAECSRINTACGNYQAKEDAKVRAAETARLADLNESEQKRLADIANAKTIDDVDAANEAASRRAAISQPVMPVMPVAKGQIVKWVWKFEVTDPLKLANFCPSAVKMEPLAREITSRLPAERPDAVYNDLPGVRAWTVLESTVSGRATKPGKVVEV